jgi:hypothetical protein
LNNNSDGVGGSGGAATLSSGGFGPAVFGSSATGGAVTVSGTAIGGNASGGGFFGGAGASINLLSNGGANDAVGGATSGTLNLTQTAIGGNGGQSDVDGSPGIGGNASSTLIGTNPYGSSNYNLTANATGGNAGSSGRLNGFGGNASAVVDATSSTAGTVTATASAQGGGPFQFPRPGFGSGGSANAVANATGLGDGSATATATGGNFLCFLCGLGGNANATANTNVLNGGPASAIATGGAGGGDPHGGSGGAATASASATNGGPASATATGGNSILGGNGGAANATATSTAMLGGTANATGGRSRHCWCRKRQFICYDDKRQLGASAVDRQRLQSFSVASGFAADSVAVVLGSMGAGGVGGSISYQELANFSVSVATDPLFTVDLLDNKSAGKGFDSATFQIIENGTVIENHLFTDLASAQAFFSDNLINLTLLAGLNIIQLSFSEKISGGDGFAFDYAAISPIITPLPTTLPLFATGLAGLGLLGWRRKKKAPPLHA